MSQSPRLGQPRHFGDSAAAGMSTQENVQFISAVTALMSIKQPGHSNSLSGKVANSGKRDRPESFLRMHRA